MTDDVATITLDRPEKLNALSPGIIRNVDLALDQIADLEGQQDHDRAADRTLEEAIDAESQAQVFASGTDDHTEGVTAFQEDRDPEFEGR